MLMSCMDFTNSYLYRHVSSLQGAGKIDQKTKELLFTVSMVG